MEYTRTLKRVGLESLMLCSVYCRYYEQQLPLLPNKKKVKLYNIMYEYKKGNVYPG